MKPISYPEMNSLEATKPGAQAFLGRTLWWTEKRDGSQLCLWAEGEEIKIATRHQDASPQFAEYFWSTPQAQMVKDLLLNEGASAVGIFGPYVLFGEMLVKGRSPARYETHLQHEFVAFDLVDQKTGLWLPAPAAWRRCLHFGVPFVELWGESSHTTLESLYAFRDSMLTLARERGREGVVLKSLVVGQPLYAKEKLDKPGYVRVEHDTGSVQYPPLPDSEAFGAVAKAHADLGADFTDKRRAMPLITQYVVEEQKKHLCTKPAMPIYWYYTEYVRGTSSTDSN